MNEEINPYLPPASASVRSSTRRWQIEGNRLLVRDGTVLPRVDLFTGVSEATMKTKVYRVKRPGLLQVFSGVFVIGGCFLLKYHFGIEPPGGILPYLLCGGFLIDLIAVKLGWSKPAYTFTSFWDASRHRSATMRNAGYIVFTLIAFGILLLGIFNVATIVQWGNWIFYVMFGLVIGVSGLALWSAAIEARHRPQALEDGWIQVKSIHPDAIRLLQSEQDRLDLLEAGQSPRNPLTIRVILHRFPLGFLLDGQSHKILLALRILWLKWTRSPRLEREMLHHSEALELDRNELHPRLSEACVSWLSSHPDWHFVHGETLANLDGDATTQTAILTRYDRLVTLRLTRTWLESRPDAARIGCAFITRLTGGNRRCTLDQPFLNLPGARDHHHRFRGKPEAIYQKHLALIQQDAVHPPASDDELLADLQLEKEEAERLLIAAGLHSAPVPASGPSNKN